MVRHYRSHDFSLNPQTLKNLHEHTSQRQTLQMLGHSIGKLNREIGHNKLNSNIGKSREMH